MIPCCFCCRSRNQNWPGVFSSVHRSQSLSEQTGDHQEGDDRAAREDDQTQGRRGQSIGGSGTALDPAWRCGSFQKRALKLQQQKQKEALEKEQQREKELERERQLTARPAKRSWMFPLQELRSITTLDFYLFLTGDRWDVLSPAVPPLWLCPLILQNLLLQICQTSGCFLSDLWPGGAAQSHIFSSSVSLPGQTNRFIYYFCHAHQPPQTKLDGFLWTFPHLVFDCIRRFFFFWSLAQTVPDVPGPFSRASDQSPPPISQNKWGNDVSVWT